MSIRKFRKKMKPFIVVMTVVFILSLVYGGYSSMRINRANKKAQEAFRINGQYIQKVEVERAKNEIQNTLSSNAANRKVEFDQDYLTVRAIDIVIRNTLMEEAAKKLGVKVSSSEVNREYKNTEDAIGNKDQFNTMLRVNGFTKDSYKDAIKKELTSRKIVEKLFSEVTDEEVNNLRSQRELKRTEENINDIKHSIVDNKISDLIYALKKEMKIEEIAPEYENFMEKEEFTYENVSVTNVNIATIMEDLAYFGVSKDKLRDEAVKYINDILKNIKIARDNGVVIDEKMSLSQALSEYEKRLRNKLMSEVKYTDQDLVNYFNANKKNYSVDPTATAKMLYISVYPDENDKKIAEDEAKKILAEVTPENFEQKGRELIKSKNYIYEDLGVFLKGQMVKPFEDAVASGKSGEIYKNVVNTSYGSHVVYVISNGENDGKYSAKHILVPVKTSEATFERINERANKLAEDIRNNKITFDNAVEKNNDLVIVRDDATFNGETNSHPIVKEIIDSNLNEVKIGKVNDETIVVYQKTNEQKYKENSYDEVKNEVKLDFLNNKVNEKIKKLNLNTK